MKPATSPAVSRAENAIERFIPVSSSLIAEFARSNDRRIEPYQLLR
jgi:hypothetical protein